MSNQEYKFDVINSYIINNLKENKYMQVGINHRTQM